MNTTFTAANIIWIKNVNDPNSDSSIVYAEMEPSDNFVLHFPERNKNSLLKPPSNTELILLFQNIDGEKYFTHIVTPIHDALIKTESSEHPCGRVVKVVAKKRILVSDTLLNPNTGGVVMGDVVQIANLEIIKKEGSLHSIQDNIWNKFHE